MATALVRHSTLLMPMLVGRPRLQTTLPRTTLSYLSPPCCCLHTVVASEDPVMVPYFVANGPNLTGLGRAGSDISKSSLLALIHLEVISAKHGELEARPLSKNSIFHPICYAHDLLNEMLGADVVTGRPKDYAFAGLAMCSSMTIRLYADRKKWPLRHILVTVQELGNGAGTIPDGLQVKLVLEGDLTEAQKQRLVEISAKCPVKQMMLGKMPNGITDISSIVARYKFEDFLKGKFKSWFSHGNVSNFKMVPRGKINEGTISGYQKHTSSVPKSKYRGE